MYKEERLRKMLRSDVDLSKVEIILQYRREALDLFEKIKNKGRNPEANEIMDNIYVQLSNLYAAFTYYMKPPQKSETMQSIGLWLNISRERVSQLEKQGLRRLQSPALQDAWDEIQEDLNDMARERLLKSSKVTA